MFFKKNFKKIVLFFLCHLFSLYSFFPYIPFNSESDLR